MIFVPGNDMGVALKPNDPNICAYTDNIGFVLDFCSESIVIYDCFTIKHHIQIGEFLSADANTVKKWFLNVCISHSTSFLM